MIFHCFLYLPRNIFHAFELFQEFHRYFISHSHWNHGIIGDEQHLKKFVLHAAFDFAAVITYHTRLHNTLSSFRDYFQLTDYQSYRKDAFAGAWIFFLNTRRNNTLCAFQRYSIIVAHTLILLSRHFMDIACYYDFRLSCITLDGMHITIILTQLLHASHSSRSRYCHNIGYHGSSNELDALSLVIASYFHNTVTLTLLWLELSMSLLLHWRSYVIIVFLWVISLS